MTYVNEFVLRAIAGIETLKNRDEEGAALAEYGLLVALIACVAIIAIAAVGEGVVDTLEALAAELGGAP